MLMKTEIAPVLTKLPHYVPPRSKIEQRMVPLQHPNPDVQRDGGPNLCWFDELLGRHFGEGDAGLFIPNVGKSHENRPFLMIVSGPPGSGKSGFALQMCYNFARRTGDRDTSGRPAALYITTETSCQQIIDKATGFGWRDDVFRDLAVKPHMFAEVKYAGSIPESTCYIHAVPNGPPAVTNAVHPDHGGDGHVPTMESLENYNSIHPEILVIDSFNTLPDFDTEDRSGDDHPITRLTRFCCNRHAMRPRLFILVLDVETGEDHLTKRFSFFADATIKFDMLTDAEGLLHRTVEITKIKSQKHAVGKHAIEIVDRPPSIEKRDKSPFLKEGGIFVYPSISWQLDYLREFKPSSDASSKASNPLPFRVLPEDLGRIIAPGTRELQGFIPGHTVSLIGRYGILKNRCAYASLLKNVIDEGKSGLIVSLDADKDVVTDILAGIVETEFGTKLNEFQETLKGEELKELIEPGTNGFRKRLANAFINDRFHRDQLGFIHNEPAYITPAEFYHRVYVAYKRPRQSSKDSEPIQPVTFVIVDGLDRIETKFPLCAKEPLFVSTLASPLFKIDKTTSRAVFISSQDPALDGGSSASALMPLSDLLLRFEEPDDLDKCRESINFLPLVRESEERARVCTEVHTMRVPFGVNSEPKGILWTTRSGNLRFNIPGPYDDANLDQSGHFE